MLALIKRPEFTSYDSTSIPKLFESLISSRDINESSTIFFNNITFSQVISQFLQKLDRIEKLEENWDGYNAASASKEAIQNARNFIITHNHLALPFYFITAGVNGEVMLEFNQDSKAAELYFNGDGSTELILFKNDTVFLEGELEDNFQDLIDFFNE